MNSWKAWKQKEEEYKRKMPCILSGKKKKKLVQDYGKHGLTQTMNLDHIW